MFEYLQSTVELTWYWGHQRACYSSERHAPTHFNSTVIRTHRILSSWFHFCCNENSILRIHLGNSDQGTLILTFSLQRTIHSLLNHKIKLAT